MARFYANECFPFPAVEELRRLGHDVLTTKDVGADQQAIEDEKVLAYAVSEHRAVLTLNRLDFKRLHRRNDAHAGIVVCTQDTTQKLAAHVDAAVRGRNLTGQLISVVRDP